MNIFQTVIPETEPEHLGFLRICHGRVYCLVITLSFTEKTNKQTNRQPDANKGSKPQFTERVQCTSSQALELKMEVVLYANKSESLGIGKGGQKEGSQRMFLLILDIPTQEMHPEQCSHPDHNPLVREKTKENNANFEVWEHH